MLFGCIEYKYVSYKSDAAQANVTVGLRPITLFFV